MNGIVLAACLGVSNWQVVTVVLLAVLVGALLPVLMQLRATLRAAETTMTRTLPRIDEAMQDVRRLTTDASRLLEGLDSSRQLAGAVGAAVGPAILAGLRAYRSSHIDGKKEPDHEQRAGHDGGN